MEIINNIKNLNNNIEFIGLETHADSIDRLNINNEYFLEIDSEYSYKVYEEPSVNFNEIIPIFFYLKDIKEVVYRDEYINFTQEKKELIDELEKRVRKYLDIY